MRLQLNNIYYKNIEIDEEILKKLPINGNLSKELQSLEIDMTKNTNDNSDKSNIHLEIMIIQLLNQIY